MKVSIHDDYFDTLRMLGCFERLADHDVEPANGRNRPMCRRWFEPGVRPARSPRHVFL